MRGKKARDENVLRFERKHRARDESLLMVMEKLNGFLLLKIFIIYYLLLFWEGLVGKRCDISKCLDRIFIMQIGKLCNLLMFKHINWWNRVINSNI